jgi:hypothetical protein
MHSCVFYRYIKVKYPFRLLIKVISRNTALDYQAKSARFLEIMMNRAGATEFPENMQEAAAVLVLDNQAATLASSFKSSKKWFEKIVAFLVFYPRPFLISLGVEFVHDLKAFLNEVRSE